MNATIGKYLNFNLPDLGLTYYRGDYYVRFELGANLENGSSQRVIQATDRAVNIFMYTIDRSDMLLFVEEFDYDFYDPDEKNKNYLKSILHNSYLERIKGPFDQTYFEIDALGNKVEQIFDEKLYCDLLIGKIMISDEQVRQLLEGKAKLEIGIEPSIPQDLTFFSPGRLTGFRMYDDRGCDIWSPDKEVLRPIYEKFNNWILDYDRPDIDKIFN